MERGPEIGEQGADVEIKDSVITRSTIISRNGNNISKLAHIRKIEEAIEYVTKFEVVKLLAEHEVADFKGIWGHGLYNELAHADSSTRDGTKHHTYYSIRIRKLYDIITSKSELALAFQEDGERLRKIVEKHESVLRANDTNFETISRYGYNARFYPSRRREKTLSADATQSKD